MQGGGIGERVLGAWESGAGCSPAEQALLALEAIAPEGHAIQDLAGAPLCARDAALLAARTSLFGPDFEAVVECPACGADFDLPLDLSDFAGTPPPAENVTVQADGVVLTVRPPSAQDLLDLPRELPPAAFAAMLFERCILSATCDGRAVAKADLPPALRAAAAGALSAGAMESPAADLTCGACGHMWQAPIDIAATLLRDIDGWATRQLDDVHRIARAYHWTERDILALSPARRRFYLDAIG